MRGSRLLLASDLRDPGHEGGHFGVHARRVLQSARVTPGRDTVHGPAATSLAHQWATAVATATVHMVTTEGRASAQHAAGQPVAIVTLAMALAQDRDGGLLQGFRVRPS